MKTGKKSKKTPGLYKENRLLEVCDLLNKQKAKYLVIGAMACNLHGLIRATKDIDLLIPQNKKNTEHVLEGLSQVGFGIAKELDAETVSQKPFTIIGDIPRIDLVTIANKVKYEQAIKKALKIKINQIIIPYVDFETLIKTKQTGRLQDAADIETLTRIKSKK